MAIITRNAKVTDFEGEFWSLVGSADTETGTVTHIIYTSSGEEIARGSLDDLVKRTEQLGSIGPQDTFAADVIAQLQSTDAALRESIPPPTPPVVSPPVTAGEREFIEGFPDATEEEIATLPRLSAIPFTPQDTPPAPVRSALPNRQPLPNQLHSYPSYTYGISLHLLTSKEYNDVVNTQKYTPKRVLIASAGRYDKSTFPRGERFAEDFYFDDLEIETIIGPNATSRNTNAIKIAFTIIEPYGFSLMERLIDSTNDVGANNYLDMPYLLEIDFFAHNDAGEIVGKLSDITKRIPIKLAAIDVKASMRGSEYAVQAYPFNHSAYDVTTVSGPKDIEIVAGSISDFFASNPVEINLTKDTDNATREVPTSPFGTTAYDGLTAPNYNSTKSTFSSYAGALNYFYQDIKNKNFTETSDRFYFEIDPKILAGEKFTIFTDKHNDHAANKMVDKKNTYAIRISNITQRNINNESNKKIFSINAGTSIEKVINDVINMSDYVQKQLVIPEGYADAKQHRAALALNADAPLDWFKIVPTVRLGDWDSKKRVWQRDITYHVQSYTVKNVKLDIAPQLTEDSPVKRYEYLYSGKNNDIIDWDLHFNALYYNAMTVYKNAMSIIGNLGNKRADEESRVSASELKIDYANAVMPMTYKPTVSQAQFTAGTDAQTVRRMAVADLEESLMTMSGADMLQVKLKIIGDPAFIKQDDIFYPPSAFEKVTEVGQGGDQRLTPNGSLRTDNGEVYVQLMFRHPRDIDEKTGTMLFNDNSKTSVFSGNYKLLTVTSNFAQGAFIQTLNMVRLPNQRAFDPADVNPVKVDRVEDALAPESQPIVVEPESLPPPAADPEEGKPADDTPAEEAVPAVDPDQPDLANVAATAETETITAATEPQAVVPPPDAAKIKELQDKEREINNAIVSLSDSFFSTSVPFRRSAANAFDSETAKARQAIVDATAQFGPDAPIIQDFQRTIARNEKTKAERNIVADRAQAELDSKRAELATVQSQLSTLRGT